ncbi:F-box only protein 6-like [Hemicordylus capensis]|uniref:F-box only protein 6-like n=1 Tax=Hemicordylus capensis TaxID=884348 RepID=UPI002302804A|nr:F-box only protein 6-like [Hemicordylus capensis]XP_053136841.1 F-box only protein 6-like [Hemicordylus capensis]
MLNVADLPEDLLLDVLSWVPAKDLVLSCRLVCSHWRDLVDLPTPWKRKCQREGYYYKRLDRSIQDWRAAYFLFSLRRNLIKNPYAEEGFDFWEIQSNGRKKWRIEELPGDCGQRSPHPHVQKYFVTSFEACTKQQLISLKEEGYWDQLMDKAKPAIVVRDWYTAQHDCGCRYQLCVKLLSSDYIVLEEFSTEDLVIEQWGDAEWREALYTFQNYPSGVRYILFEHGGEDTRYWAGWYGIRVTNSSITITPDVVE